MKQLIAVLAAALFAAASVNAIAQEKKGDGMEAKPAKTAKKKAAPKKTVKKAVKKQEAPK